MHLPFALVLISFVSISTKPINSLSMAKIIDARYSMGSSFLKINLPTSGLCMCYCIQHPHCLSISVTILSTNLYFCQLFATYPTKSSQLSSSFTSNVTVYSDRTMSSVYLSNGTHLTNPTNLFSNPTDPWIPIFKLYTANNQSFLTLNSSNLTTLTTIPSISIDHPTSHWFSILISQWNQNLYTPNQVAIAFIVNKTILFEFLIFNGTQSNTTAWFSILRLISSEYWAISQYKSTTIGQTQMVPLYTDSDCVRSLNCNFKYSTSGCSQDYYGFFFIYGGYKDSCLAAVRNISQVFVPTIFYSPTTAYTNGKLDYFNISDGLMGFIR